MSNLNNMTKGNLAATRVIQRIDAVRRQNTVEVRKNNRTMFYVVTGVIAFLVGFTAFLFLYSCAHWSETEHLAVCHTNKE